MQYDLKNWNLPWIPHTEERKKLEERYEMMHEKQTLERDKIL